MFGSACYATSNKLSDAGVRNLNQAAGTGRALGGALKNSREMLHQQKRLVKGLEAGS